MRKVICNGMVYPSIASFCRLNGGMSEDKVSRMLAEGLTPEAILVEYGNSSINRFISYQGESFSSVRAFCNRFDLPYNQTLRKLDDGMSPEEIINTRDMPRVRHRTERIELFLSSNEAHKKVNAIEEERRKFQSQIESDLEQMSYKRVAERYGISYTMFTRKLRSGIPPEKALSECLKKSQKKEELIEYDGIRYESSAELCEKLGISYDKFRRLKRKGLSTQDAVGMCMELSGKSIPIKVGDEEFPSYRAYCRAKGITLKTLQYQLERKIIINELTKSD